MSGQDSNVVLEFEETNERLLHRLRIGRGEVDSADRAGEQGVSGEKRAAGSVEESHRTGAVTGQMENRPTRSEGTGVTSLKSRIGRRSGGRHPEKRRKIQHRLLIPCGFQFVTSDRHRTEASQGPIDARDVIVMTVGEQDPRQGSTRGLHRVEQRLGSITTVDEPTGLRIAFVGDHEGVGLVVAERNGGEDGIGRGRRMGMGHAP